MQLDVVIPSHNYGRYLRQCVESVLAQDVAGLRVLVIDDASTDDTPAVGAALAAADPRVTFRRHAVNQGHIATYNEGIAWLAADCMLLLSADDWLLPGAAGRALRMMAAHSDLGLCFGNAVELLPDHRARPIKVDVGGCGSHVLAGHRFIDIAARAGTRNVVPTPTAFVRTRLLHRLGGYREDLPHSADLELWLRLAAHAPVGFVAPAQAVYRRHAGNMSLGYIHDNMLKDLLQRRAAVDAFIESCGARFADAGALRAQLLQSLARDAIGEASRAFNDGREEACDRACAFALGLHPAVRRSMHWHRLQFKRRLGHARSTSLMAKAEALRRFAAGLRQREPSA